jgi:sulfite reductase (NADPH) hemoprotein beta-component
MSADAPVKLTHNEEIKAAIPTLAGTIAATMADTATDHFSEDDNQFLKFHGSYQQDDRDLRKTGKKYIMMIRSRIPGGVMTARQYAAFDALASTYGNHTLRVTTRQTIQFHGVVKNNLRAAVKAINDTLLSTLAACGDVNRNVLAPPTPAYTRAREQVYAHAHAVALALAPQTKAYHAIWIDGRQLDLNADENKDFVDPLYGQTYLPRKFKVAFVIPPVNDLDVFTNCLGFTAIVEHDLGGRRHGPQPRQRRHLSAPGGCHRLRAAGPGAGRGPGHAHHPPGFWRPHRPPPRAPEIRHRRARRGLGAGGN